ncbi:MAG: toll/interleukin-1 receptor domain-containing protein [Bdellovibrionota bacterium]
MKLKGLALTLPICDLRPCLDPESRLKSLSPDVATLGETHIIGFGAAKRRKLNIPWRERDTVFFKCHGAISLPEYMPDGESVDRAVRRLYLDELALVRFEFMIFGPPKHHFVEYRRRADEFARDFWESRLRITERRCKTEETFATAIPKLVNKFVAMTTPEFKTRPIRSDLVKALEPLIQVIAEISAKEREALNPEHSYDESKICLAFRSLKMKGRATSVDTVYITFPPGSFNRPGKPEYEPLDQIRAHMAWLHADLEILTHILRKCVRNEIDPTVVSAYLKRLADGLRDAPRLGQPEREILIELVRDMDKFHHNRVSLLLAGLRESALPTRLKNEVDDMLRRYLLGGSPPKVELKRRYEDMTTDDSIEPSPRVLISYAWEDAAHKQWVKDLGTKLRTEGVDIILDEWSTALGDRLPHFMEQAVHGSDFVVYICTPEYKRKSDGRIRGVGYEGNIITAELYATSNERKFIPVLRKGTWDDATPTWAGGKRGVDLTGDPYSEDQYEDLLQCLHSLTEGPPALGPKPSKDRFKAKATKKDADTDTGSGTVKVGAARPVTDEDLRDMKLELQHIDALNIGKADSDIGVVRGKLQKIYVLENMVRRLQAEGRPAKAWHLQRWIYKIEREGRVSTDFQRRIDEINDIEAERSALREDERRKERK